MWSCIHHHQIPYPVHYPASSVMTGLVVAGTLKCDLTVKKEINISRRIDQ
jgi:hypothetical protein